MSEYVTMAEQAVARGRSTFRGHQIVWVGEKWLYADTLQPIPGYGGDNRPCLKCGSSKWSGTGDHDACLGLLPGVTNACCGHGDPSQSYIVFEGGLCVRGFVVEEEAN